MRKLIAAADAAVAAAVAARRPTDPITRQLSLSFNGVTLRRRFCRERARTLTRVCAKAGARGRAMRDANARAHLNASVARETKTIQHERRVRARISA